MFDIDRGGIYLVKGENGAGKTTIFNALVWGLYQINLKGLANAEVASWEHVRGPKFQGTRVMVMVEVEGVHYCIARHLNYKGETHGIRGDSKLIVFSDTLQTWGESGWDILPDQHKSDQQQMIDRLIGMDSRAFMSSVMFGQRMSRFIAADPAEKRALFETVFGLGFVEAAKSEAQKMFDTLAAEMGEVSAKMRGRQSTLAQLTTRLDRIDSQLAEFIRRKAEKVANFTDRIERQAEEIGSLRTQITANTEAMSFHTASADPELETAWKEAKAAVDKAKGDRAMLNSKVQSYNGEITRQGQKWEKANGELLGVSTICPTCGGDLKEDQVKEAKAALKKVVDQEREALTVLQQQRDKLAEQVNDLADAMPGLESALEVAYAAYAGVKEAADRVQELRTRMAADKARLEQMEKTLAMLRSDLEEAQIEQAVLEDPAILEKERSEILALIQEDETKLGSMNKKSDKIQWWIKKGFGANGLKAYIFNAMLDSLNMAVTKYAETLGYNVVFTIDLTKASKPFLTTCYMHDRVVNYEALSGGQKQRVDVALAMALHDVIAGTKQINLLIMDEVFEGLDTPGINMVFDLLREKLSMRGTMYIVTHSEHVDWLNAKTITARLEGDNTVIE